MPAKREQLLDGAATRRPPRRGRIGTRMRVRLASRGGVALAHLVAVYRRSHVVFYLQQMLWQQLAGGAIGFAIAVARQRMPFKVTTVDPLLDDDVSFRFELEISLTRIFAKRPILTGRSCHPRFAQYLTKPWKRAHLSGYIANRHPKGLFRLGEPTRGVAFPPRVTIQSQITAE